MSSTEEILDQIDHVLEDWEVGPDAMRWTPEVPDPPARAFMWPVLSDHARLHAASHIVVQPRRDDAGIEWIDPEPLTAGRGFELVEWQRQLLRYWRNDRPPHTRCGCSVLPPFNNDANPGEER